MSPWQPNPLNPSSTPGRIEYWLGDRDEGELLLTVMGAHRNRYWDFIPSQGTYIAYCPEGGEEQSYRVGAVHIVLEEMTEGNGEVSIRPVVKVELQP